MSQPIAFTPELEDSVSFNMGLVYKQFRTIANQALSVEFDITLEMLAALKAVVYLGKIPQQQLAETLQRERSATKRLVDNCIKRGLLEAHKDDNNKKARYIGISEKGRYVSDSASQCVTTIKEDFFKPLSKQEQDLLLSFCKRLINEGVRI